MYAYYTEDLSPRFLCSNEGGISIIPRVSYRFFVGGGEGRTSLHSTVRLMHGNLARISLEICCFGIESGGFEHL